MALRAAVLALSLLSLAACSTAPAPYTGTYWGADATATPGWGRLGEAALTAAADTVPWLPAAPAAGHQNRGADHAIPACAKAEPTLSSTPATPAEHDRTVWRARMGRSGWYRGGAGHL